jgi:hypothetical protein
VTASMAPFSYCAALPAGRPSNQLLCCPTGGTTKQPTTMLPNRRDDQGTNYCAAQPAGRPRNHLPRLAARQDLGLPRLTAREDLGLPHVDLVGEADLGSASPGRQTVPGLRQNVVPSVFQVVPSRTATPHTPPKIGRQRPRTSAGLRSQTQVGSWATSASGRVGLVVSSGVKSSQWSKASSRDGGFCGRRRPVRRRSRSRPAAARRRPPPDASPAPRHHRKPGPSWERFVP